MRSGHETLPSSAVYDELCSLGKPLMTFGSSCHTIAAWVQVPANENTYLTQMCVQVPANENTYLTQMCILLLLEISDLASLK